jgi:copper resistance protein D
MDFAFIVARLAQLAAAMTLGGAALFFVHGYRPGPEAWPRRMALAAAALGVVATLAWLLLQAARFADGRPVLAVLSDVALGTSFGVAAALRAFGFAAAILLLLLRKPWIWLAALGGAVVASFAWTGHGAFDDGLVGLAHQTADITHLIAAAVWIGALMVLLILVVRGARSPVEHEAARQALERFSSLGFGVVAALVLSGLINSVFLVGLEALPTALRSPYGRLLAIKLLVFAAMLGLAALNRWRLTPRLAQGREGQGGLAAVRISIALETALGVAVLALVAWLGTLEPPING